MNSTAKPCAHRAGASARSASTWLLTLTRRCLGLDWRDDHDHDHGREQRRSRAQTRARARLTRIAAAIESSNPSHAADLRAAASANDSAAWGIHE